MNAHDLSGGKRRAPSTVESLAETIREAFVEEALRAYEDAKMRGLCDEGAWECAVGAVRSMDVRALVDP